MEKQNIPVHVLIPNAGNLYIGNKENAVLRTASLLRQPPGTADHKIWDSYSLSSFGRKRDMRKGNQHNLLKLTVILFTMSFICQIGFSYSQADLNRDGIVTFEDFSVFANSWLVEDYNKVGYLVAASDASSRAKSHADYVCDGTADDVEIQEAIDSLPVAGGKIYLSEGTFNITSKISIPNDVWLQGFGFSTVIDSGTLTTIVLENSDTSIGNSQIVITDLKLDVSSMASDKSAIHLKKVNHSYVSNVYIVGGGEGEYGEHGIYLETVAHSRIVNVTIETVNNNSIIIGQGCSDIIIENVISIDPYLDHIHIEGQDDSGNNNRRIVINNITGHEGHHGFYVDHANDVSISNANLYNIRYDGFIVGKTFASEISLSNSLFDTNTHPTQDLCFFYPNSSHINISNCIFKNAQNHGISLQQAGSEDVTITGCKIINSGDGGIRTMGSYVTISNCTVDGTGNGTAPNGIYAGGDHLMISNCHFKDVNNDGIRITGDDVSISNCRVENCREYGFYCAGDRINISNCTVDTVTGGTEPSAVKGGGTDIIIDNCIFQNIDDFGVTTSGKYGDVSNLIVRGCLFKSIGDIVYHGNSKNKNVTFVNNIIDDFNDCDTMYIMGDNIIVMGNRWVNPPTPLTRLIYVESTSDYVWITNNDFSVIADPIYDAGAGHLTQTPNMSR